MAQTLYPNITNLVDPGLQVAYVAGVTGGLDDISLFSFEPTNLGSIKHQGYNPSPGYVVSAEAGTIATNAITEAYLQTWTHTEYENGLYLSRKAKLTLSARPQIIFDWLQSMGLAYFQHLATRAWDLLNNAFATNLGDGVPLCSAVHPSEAGNQDNLGASAMDTAAIEAAEREVRLAQTATGQKGAYQGTALVFPLALRQTAHAAMGSQFTSAALQHSITSTLPLRLVPSRYLTSATAWFVADERYTRQSLVGYILQGSDPVETTRHMDDHSHRFTDKAIDAFNAGDWRGIFGTA